MKRLLFLTILFLSVSISFAQTQQGIVKTRGRMTATGTVIPGTRLSGATVNVRNVSALVTGKNGSFLFAVPSSKTFYLTSVKKQGYMLCDNDVIGKGCQYSANPFVVVMETPDNNTADRLAAEKKIRRTLQRQLQDKEDEIERLKEQQKITGAEYNKLLQDLYAQQGKNEDLISEMAQRYSAIDFDEMDEFQRKVAFYIQNGELARADSLLNTKGSMEERSAELDRMDAAIKADADELVKRKKAHEKIVAMKAKNLEDFAADCYSRYEICKMQHKNDSAAYWLELRASKDTTNIIWLYNVARFYKEYQINYEKAYSYYVKALDISIKKYGLGASSVGIAYDNIADVLYFQNKNEDAISYYQKAIEQFEVSSPDFLGIPCNGIALVYQEKNEYSKALEYYAKAIECDSLYGRKNDLAAVYGNLGRLYYKIAKYDKAYLCMVKSLKMHIEESGEKNSSVLHEYSNIGSLFTKIGQYKKATEYYEKAKSISEELYGNSHPATAVIISQIATNYFSQGDYSTALQYHQKAYEIRKSTWGKYHRDVAVSLINIGSTLKVLDKPEESKQYCQQALEILLVLFGERNLDVASCYSNIASACMALEDYENAIIWEGKSLNIRKEILPQDHPDFATSYNNLALSYLGNKDLKNAKDCQKKSMDLLIAKYGERHPNVAGAYNNMGQLYIKMEQYEEALENYEHSLAIAIELLGEKHANVATVYYNLAKPCYLLGRTSEACEYINKAYSICLETLGCDHSLTKKVLERKSEYDCK